VIENRRATADEDGHYCLAMALWCGARARDILSGDLPNCARMLRRDAF